MDRSLFAVLAAVGLTLTIAVTAPAAGPIRIMVNGRILSPDAPPAIVGGRVLVPLRGIFEQLGALVRWKSITRTVVIVRLGTYVSLRVGERTATVNGRSVPLDVPAQVVRSRVLVPLRFVGEAFGARVRWRAADRTVMITTSQAGLPKPERPAEVGGQIVTVPPPTAQPAPPDLGESVSVERGKVVASLSKGEFRVGESIVVTVANGLDRTIYSDDFKTECSIITLQRQVGSRWEPITGCALGRPTMVVAIGSGRGRSISIDPRSMHLQKAAAGSPLAFSAGTYRIAFSYRFGRQMGAAEQTVYSPSFSIR